MSARGEDRKAAILDAAIARIVDGGLEGLRVRDVAQDVGINNATLHHHFPTKTSLIAAIVQRFVTRFSTKGGVPEEGGELEARLAAYVASRHEAMRRDPATYIVLSELMILARRDAEVRRLIAAMQVQWRDYLVGVCREAGLDRETAFARAERCRHEIIGLGLEIGLEPFEG